MNAHFRSTPLILLVLLLPVLGDPPQWWQEGNPPVVDPAAAANPRGPATIGQAKWMAKRALESLAAIDAQLATGIEQRLTQAQPDQNGGMIPAILDFGVPDAPQDGAWRERQHAPLLLGQLKAIATPFYDLLHTAAPAWLDHESSDPAAQGQLQLNGTKDPNDAANFHPWTSDPGDDANHAITTIGQLKAVFSLRFETLPPVDSDGDGLPDSWEMSYFGNLDQTGPGDPDHDGLTNQQELAMGTDPTAIGTDDDGNGLPDDWELSHAGKFAAYPPLLSASLFKYESSTAPILLKNDTWETVNYTINVSGNTQPVYSYNGWLPDFFSVSPQTGTLAPHAVASVTGIFDALILPTAVYEADVTLTDVRPGSQPQLLTARLQVKWDGHYAAVALTSPTEGQSVLQGQSIVFAATASDSDGVAKVEFYSGNCKLGEANTPSGSDYRYTLIAGLAPGNHRIIAKVTTHAGITTASAAVTLIVLADTDLDGMPNQWELDHGLDPNNPNDAAADQDGDDLTNLEEYLADSNPCFPGIHAFAETYNSDGTITYSWISNAALGDWFRIEDDLPDGTFKTLYETTYGSARLPYVPGVTSYSLTLDPATDYLP